MWRETLSNKGEQMNIEKYLPYMLIAVIAVSVLAAVMVNRG
jgi:hypothetical protein